MKTLSGPALVDRDIAPLVTALNEAGIPTVASCVNLREAVSELAPEWLPALRRQGAPEPNYQGLMDSGHAFVRLLTGETEQVRRLASLARAVGGDIQGTYPALQVSFPFHLMSALMPRRSGIPT